MRVQSAKAKGRRLQQWVRDQLIEKLEVHREDIESRSMGAGGEDLIMALMHETNSHIQSNVKIKKRLMSGNHMNRRKKILKLMNLL